MDPPTPSADAFEEAQRRAWARLAMEEGRLPNRLANRIVGMAGSGERCAVCERWLESPEPEFELQFAREGQHGLPDTYYVHIRCFAAWVLERDEGV